MRRTALLALLPVPMLLLAGCGHHGSAAVAGSSSPSPGADLWPSTSSSAARSPSPSTAGTRSAPASPAASTASTAPTGAASAPGAGGPAAPGSPTGGATTGTTQAGSPASAQGLDRPVGDFGSVRGISGVMSESGLVSGFSDAVTVAAGHAESLTAATAQLSTYLPGGSSYGAASTSGACRTVQLLGSKHPTDVAFCSDTANGSGSRTFTASSIAAITVSADAGLS